MTMSSNSFTIPDPAGKIAILYDALDWLEANPDRAIRGDFALDIFGAVCDPRTTDALCFCFLGRVQHMTGLSIQPGSLPDWLGEAGANWRVLLNINDDEADRTRRFETLRFYIDEVARSVSVKPRSIKPIGKPA